MSRKSKYPIDDEESVNKVTGLKDDESLSSIDDTSAYVKRRKLSGSRNESVDKSAKASTSTKASTSACASTSTCHPKIHPKFVSPNLLC
jgi:hypothetical protein